MGGGLQKIKKSNCAIPRVNNSQSSEKRSGALPKPKHSNTIPPSSTTTTDRGSKLRLFFSLLPLLSLQPIDLRGKQQGRRRLSAYLTRHQL